MVRFYRLDQHNNAATFAFRVVAKKSTPSFAVARRRRFRENDVRLMRSDALMISARWPGANPWIP